MPPKTCHGLSDTPYCAYLYAQLENQSCVRTFYLSNDCSTIGDIYSLAWVRAVCKIRTMRYASKRTSQPLSNATSCVYCTRNSKTTGRIWTFYISNDCSTIGDVGDISVLELDARKEWRVMAPSTHRSRLPISHLCVYSCTQPENFRPFVDALQI